MKHSLLLWSAGIAAFCSGIEKPHEIYQDVLIQGKVVEKGQRSCQDRYDAIKPMLRTLPLNAKIVDIGASQGFFSFKMAEEFGFRCTMIEGGYSISNAVWSTGQFLQYLCEQNNQLKGITLLQRLCTIDDLQYLHQHEPFDAVLAFSVIHHMRSSVDQPFEHFNHVIDAILALAEVALIENPVNTGPHTLFIRESLQKRGGKLLYQSKRGTLTYEIYLFDNRKRYPEVSIMPCITPQTYNQLQGTYSS